MAAKSGKSKRKVFYSVGNTVDNQVKVSRPSSRKAALGECTPQA